MSDQNPKHIRALKDGKVPYEYLVLSVLEDDAHVHKGGGDKYGIRNWTIDNILASTYIGAMFRHYKAWCEGEDLDPESGRPHLTHLRACCAVVMDGQKHGKLIDDRLKAESKDPETGAVKTGFNFDHCPDSTTYEEPVEDLCCYVVQFCNTHGNLKLNSFEGPFPTLRVAEIYARRNPSNIKGLKSIHAINPPTEE